MCVLLDFWCIFFCKVKLIINFFATDLFQVYKRKKNFFENLWIEHLDSYHIVWHPNCLCKYWNLELILIRCAKYHLKFNQIFAANGFLLMVFCLFVCFQVCGITGRSYTYSQLRDHSAALAIRLHTKLNLQIGEVIAVCLPNMPEFPIAALGSMEAGLIVTTINPIYTAGK